MKWILIKATGVQQPITDEFYEEHKGEDWFLDCKSAPKGVGTCNVGKVAKPKRALEDVVREQLKDEIEAKERAAMEEEIRAKIEGEERAALEAEIRAKIEAEKKPVRKTAAKK